MARKQRIHKSKAFYHVMLRGNNGQDIFFSNQDRCRFCLLIQQGIERFGHQIHGFCLMNNHIHLVVQPSETSLSHIMHHLSFRYARYFNRMYSRIGHLFQGRFKSILVDAENYLTELVRYIHLNPVRAGMVSLPIEYNWSGHKAYMGLVDISWLAQDWILRKFHAYRDPARKLYSEYILHGIGEPLNQEFYHHCIAGGLLATESEREKHIIKSSLNYSITDLIKIVSKNFNLPAEALRLPGKRRELVEARGVMTLLARNSGHITLKNLAEFFEKDPDYLSRLATSTEKKIYTVPELSKKMDQIKLELLA